MSTPQARRARPTARHEEKKTRVHTYVLRTFERCIARRRTPTLAQTRELRNTLEFGYLLGLSGVCLQPASLDDVRSVCDAP